MSPTRLMIFLNQPDVYDVASFVAGCPFPLFIFSAFLNIINHLNTVFRQAPVHQPDGIVNQTGSTQQRNVRLWTGTVTHGSPDYPKAQRAASWPHPFDMPAHDVFTFLSQNNNKLIFPPWHLN